jgi:hypothetical protein
MVPQGKAVLESVSTVDPSAAVAPEPKVCALVT